MFSVKCHVRSCPARYDCVLFSCFIVLFYEEIEWMD